MRLKTLLALFSLNRAASTEKVLQMSTTALPEENVWDYPRPARLEKFEGKLTIIDGGKVIAQSTNAFRALETSHPPTYYIPKDDVDMSLFSLNRRATMCEWKGRASYWDYTSQSSTPTRARQVLANAAWSYEEDGVTSNFVPITGFLSFYAQYFDQCLVNEEMVKAQEGDFYGGWITSNLKGPFKGIPGSKFW